MHSQRQRMRLKKRGWFWMTKADSVKFLGRILINNILYCGFLNFEFKFKHILNLNLLQFYIEFYKPLNE